MSWLWAAAAQDACVASREVTNNASIFPIKLFISFESK